MSLIVNGPDRLTRFLYNKGDFSPSKGKVRPRAFERAPGDEGLSTFLTEGLEREAVETLGRAQRAQSLKALANLPAQTYVENDLRIDPDNSPERHVYILGWPEDEELQLEIRTKLADAAELVRLTK